MKNKSVASMDRVINFIENHLEEKLDLESISKAIFYSKYHLHRMFREIVGMTLKDYIIRRKFTEAAKLLVFSEKAILEIALICGFESQQAFSTAFKAFYKVSPAEFRIQQLFYPLQLKFVLNSDKKEEEFKISDIHFADYEDIQEWMDLVDLVIDGYPCLNEEDYLNQLNESIEKGRALLLRENRLLIGIMMFSLNPGTIDFIGIHPQYRNRNLIRLFLDKLMNEIMPHEPVFITTYRENDRADTGYRKDLLNLGFSERELLYEFGYPSQRFALPPRPQEEESEKI